jgi:quinoprotein glucose dehydrogenase
MNRNAAFEATPILFNGALYLSTPFDQVISLDPATGTENWKFDPYIDRSSFEATVTSRGVVSWSADEPLTCRERIFIGTIDARLIALDAKTGKRCVDFGSGGAVDLRKDVEFRPGIEYKVTSAPVVVGDLLVVGSLVGDNQSVRVPKGVVRAYDVRSGHLKWTWEPIPWAARQSLRTGAANAWAPFAVDLQRGLIFIPTGSASPDYYGALRPGDNRYADSIVALEAATGRLVWHFQVVHHDLWDYDLASQPLLFTFRNQVPAVAVATKMGFVFVLDRTTGKPLYSVEERKVPASDVPGEQASPTQPFPALPALVPQQFRASDKFCQDQLRGSRNEGIFTPPSLKGSVLMPGNLGGVNWGSTAINPNTGVLFANTNRVAFLVKLVPREDVEGLWARAKRRLSRIDTATAEKLAAGPNRFQGEFSRQLETPYYLYRKPILTPGGLPCTPQPWGTISALNLNTGQKVWETPLGTMISGQKTGSINLGGPIARGLVITAATTEPYLRAFDAATGQEIWKGQLPVPAQATPMTYSVKGKQFIVVCAGGHGQLGTKLGDSVVAFALPK